MHIKLERTCMYMYTLHITALKAGRANNIPHTQLLCTLVCTCMLGRTLFHMYMYRHNEKGWVNCLNHHNNDRNWRL